MCGVTEETPLDPTTDTEETPMPNRWTMTSVDPQTGQDVPQGTFRGGRSAAVAAANQASEQTGSKVYTQPADATVTQPGPRDAR